MNREIESLCRIMPIEFPALVRFPYGGPDKPYFSRPQFPKSRSQSGQATQAQSPSYKALHLFKGGIRPPENGIPFVASASSPAPAPAPARRRPVSNGDKSETIDPL